MSKPEYYPLYYGSLRAFLLQRYDLKNPYEVLLDKWRRKASY